MRGINWGASSEVHRPPSIKMVGPFGAPNEIDSPQIL